MKRVFHFLAFSLCLLCLTGCDHMRYVKYEGRQNTWPTGSSFSDQMFAVPVFHALPEKPYDVIGYVEFDQPNVDWNEGDIKIAASMAKQSGGDALLMLTRADSTSQTVTSLRTSIGIDASRTRAIVLKWK